MEADLVVERVRQHRSDRVAHVHTEHEERAAQPVKLEPRVRVRHALDHYQVAQCVEHVKDEVAEEDEQKVVHDVEAAANAAEFEQEQVERAYGDQGEGDEFFVVAVFGY